MPIRQAQQEPSAVTPFKGKKSLFTPLLHTSSFPDLVQVNSKAASIEVAPSFVQGAPAHVAAWAVGTSNAIINAIDSGPIRMRFIDEE